MAGGPSYRMRTRADEIRLSPEGGLSPQRLDRGWMIFNLMPRWITTPIRGIGRVLRAFGREIAAALKFQADVESHVSPQDVARRYQRGELGRDAPAPEQKGRDDSPTAGTRKR